MTVGGEACTNIQRITAEGYSVNLWYKENASANASASVIVTCAGANFAVGAATNYSGVATSGAFDVHSCNAIGCAFQTDDATNRTAQNVTTNDANALLIFAEIGWDRHTTHTAQGSWTKRTAAGPKTRCLADRNVTSAGSYPNGTIIVVDNVADDGYYSLFASFAAAP